LAACLPIPDLQYAAMSSPDVLSILNRVSLFADLSENELRALADRTSRRKSDAGELIFSEGDPCEGLYVVESGAVRIFKTSASGREQVLAVEGPGGIVAELPVFDGGPYPASGSSVRDSSLLFISKRDFRTICLENPEVSLKVLKSVGRRLRILVGLIEELSFTTVRHRLGSLLVRLAREASPAGSAASFTLPTNNELASQIGTVRELVSRNLSRFQADGLIRMDGKDVVVPDVAALERDLEE
jgi:CRP/FNR family cyclic AMP-dependent transcriptional regulator